MILLNPGPVNLSEGVRNALTGEDLCHREPEFGELQERIRRGLLDVYGLSPDKWAAVLLTGSGTAAMEAMMTSLVPQDGKVLIIENGVYGERLANIARIHGIELTSLKYGWGKPCVVEDVERVLNEEAAVTHVAVVHHETTTGLLNDLSDIGSLCRSHGVGLLVDAVSSYGAEELDLEGWGIIACAAAANKCLHGVPGAAFVLAHRASLSDSAAGRRRTLYLDLANYLREQDRGSTPFTQSVHVFYGFAQALQEFAAQGGWRGRHRRYRRLARRVRQGLARLGIRALLPEHASSVVLSAFQVPDVVSYRDLHDGLKRRGFVVYAGQGALEHNIFRISTMGEITEGDVDQFLSALAEVLRAARVA
ncbi:MAG: 2-aminoethylphosphonate--pyruvate transaminase [Gammaproteobacteria bacterium]|jgi:2-aminoethylphosphonate-pyruvate transaminase